MVMLHKGAVEKGTAGLMATGVEETMLGAVGGVTGVEALSGGNGIRILKVGSDPVNASVVQSGLTCSHIN